MSATCHDSARFTARLRRSSSSSSGCTSAVVRRFTARSARRRTFGCARPPCGPVRHTAGVPHHLPCPTVWPPRRAGPAGACNNPVVLVSRGAYAALPRPRREASRFLPVDRVPTRHRCRRDGAGVVRERPGRRAPQPRLHAIVGWTAGVAGRGSRRHITFVQSTTGAGGWPLSIWLTPDGEPFYGGNTRHFPPASRWGRPGLVDVLKEDYAGLSAGRSASASCSRRRRSPADCAQAEACLSHRLLRLPGGARRVVSRNSLTRVRSEAPAGFGGAPKFPRPSQPPAPVSVSSPAPASRRPVTWRS